MSNAFVLQLAESGKEDMKSLLGDKLELQRKVDGLLDKIRDLERENRELERLKESVAMRHVSGRSPVPALMRDNTLAVLEEENSELRRKISKMDAEIRDMERRHVKHVADVTIQVKQVAVTKTLLYVFKAVDDHCLFRNEILSWSAAVLPNCKQNVFWKLVRGIIVHKLHD